MDISQEVQHMDISQEVQHMDISQEVQHMDISQEVQHMDISQEVQHMDISQEVQHSLTKRCMTNMRHPTGPRKVSMTQMNQAFNTTVKALYVTLDHFNA